MAAWEKVGLLVILAVVVGYLGFIGHQAVGCEKAGGVYISDSDLCLRVERLRP